MNKEYEIIDLCKFFASVIVVAIHTTNLNNCGNIYISNIWNSISILAVPFFFISTGYLSFCKYNKIEIDKIKKLLIKFIKIYVICTIVYLPITIYYYRISGFPLLKSLAYFIRSFIFIGENFNSWPLWYLLSSIYCFFILYIFCKLRFSDKQILISAIIILFVGYSITIICPLDISFLNLFNFLVNNILGGTGRILYGIGYISVGIYLAISKKRFLKSKTISFILFVILLIFPKRFKMIIAFGFIVFVFSELVTINYKSVYLDNKLFRTLSTVTYFTHMLFYTLIEFVVNNYEYRGFVPFLITLFLTWICGIFYYFVKNRHKNIDVW